jgi:hypothetical protein
MGNYKYLLSRSGVKDKKEKLDLYYELERRQKRKLTDLKFI